MNIIIVGAGSHGRVVLEIVRRYPGTNAVGFVDDDPACRGKVVDGCPVLGNCEAVPGLISDHDLDGAIIAVGGNQSRARLFEQFSSLGLRLEKAIHPRALIARDVNIGDGCVIADGAIISTGSRIGRNVIINTRAIIDHDNVIADHAHVSAMTTLAGKVMVGRFSMVGLGVTVIQDITIGENVTIGAGAVVEADVPDNAVAVGVPARVVKYREPGNGSNHG